MKVLKKLNKGTRLITGATNSGIWICPVGDSTGHFITEMELIRIYNEKQKLFEEIVKLAP